jgi:hypothetical protein
MGGFRKSSNAQLVMVADVEMFNARQRIINDTKLPADERVAKVDEAIKRGTRSRSETSAPTSARRRTVSRALRPASTRTRVRPAQMSTALPVEPLPKTVSRIPLSQQT